MSATVTPAVERLAFPAGGRRPYRHQQETWDPRRVHGFKRGITSDHRKSGKDVAALVGLSDQAMHEPSRTSHSRSRPWFPATTRASCSSAATSRRACAACRSEAWSSLNTASSWRPRAAQDSEESWTATRTIADTVDHAGHPLIHPGLIARELAQGRRAEWLDQEYRCGFVVGLVASIFGDLQPQWGR